MDQSVESLADWHYIGVEVANAATQTASVAVDATEKTAEDTVTAVVAQGGSASLAAAGAAIGSGTGLTIVAVSAVAGMGGLVAGMLLMRWRHKAGVAPPAQVVPTVEKHMDMPTDGAPLADVQQDAPAADMPLMSVQQDNVDEKVACAYPALLPAPHNDAQPVKPIDSPLDSPKPLPPAIVPEMALPYPSSEIMAEVVRPSAPSPLEPPALLQNGPPVVEGVLMSPAFTKPSLPAPPEPPAPQPVLAKPALLPPEPPAAPPQKPTAPAHSSLAVTMESASTSEKYRVRDYAVPLLAVSVLASSAVLGRAVWRCTATAARSAKRPPIRTSAPIAKPQKFPEVTIIDMASGPSRQLAPSAWPVFERTPSHIASAWVSNKCAVPNTRTSTAHGCWPQSPALPETSPMSIPHRPPPSSLASVDVEMSVMSTALGGRLGPTGRRANVRVVGGVVRPAAATSSRVFRILPGQ
mmetsp:Transcript_42160/g.75466  ORF Transcript_42160/g.75466 Transcript_42160/m.75466 type:complete len:466 (+) Transcript_42160:78-1475(+)